MKLFEVFGEVKIDDKGAVKKLGSIGDKAKKVGAGFTDVTKKVGKFALGFGAAAAAAGGALFAFADKTTESLDRIDKLSQKLNMSSKEFQEWDYVLSQNGASVDGLQIGMKTLAERMVQAQDGAGKGAEAFEALEISATDVNGELKTQGQMFNEAVAALQKVNNATEKAKLANDLFAGSAKELTPLLNQTSEATDDLKNKAEELGMVQSEDAIKAGAAFQDNLDTTKRMLGGVATKIGTTLLPMFNNMMEWIQSKMPQIQEFFTLVFDTVSPKVKYFYDLFNEKVLPVLKNLFEWVQENMPVFKESFEKALEVVLRIAKSIWDLLEVAFKPLFTWVKNNMGTIGAVVGGVFEGIAVVIETTTKVVIGIIEAFKTAYDWAKKFIKKSNEAAASREKQSSSGGWIDIKGMRAEGGPVDSGESYIVGEKGPELFTPSQSGNITANDKMSGVNIGHITVVANSKYDVENFGRDLANGAKKTLMANGIPNLAY